MKKLKRFAQHEEGQSLIIVGGLLLVLVALIGLVVDAGNAYAQRRIVQNAADSAALAGSQKLVHQEDYKVCDENGENCGPFLRNWQVIAAAEDFAERNGVDPNDLAVYYTDIGGTILADARFDLGRQDIIYEGTFGGARAEGLYVEADLSFPTYLIRVIGRNEMMASADSLGILACGACTAGTPEDGGLFPIAVYNGLFASDPNGLPVIGKQYRIFEKDSHFPGTGSFGWLTWTADPANTTLVANMEDTSRSGQWSVNDMVPSATGVMQSRGVRNELTYRVNNEVNMTPSRPATVTLPIFDVTAGNGSNKKYHAIGFGQFRIECWHTSRNQKYGPTCDFDRSDNEKWVAGTFVKWLEPTGEAGCTNFGICTAKLRAPLKVTRSLVGNVIPWQVIPAEDQICDGGDMPVDVVHVMDISGSMCAEWDGSSDEGQPCYGRADYGSPNRIYAAKDVITEFNEGMDWHADNRVGLVTYPRVQNSGGYYTDCYYALGSQCTGGSTADCGTWNDKLYFGDKNLDITGDMAYANTVVGGLSATGGTPLPVGLQYGREMVVEQNAGNMKVIILTTDGMPNVKLDGEWTGYTGNYTRPPLIVSSGCNDSVYQGAVEQANQAKDANVIIFAIGIHTSIDEDLMRAIASPSSGSDDEHFFLADTVGEFEDIYAQIQERLPTLCSEECILNENATVGAKATVKLFDDRGSLVATTTADASGGFIFSDIDPGTYELRAEWTDTRSGLFYDVLTWVLGGPPIQSGEQIEVEVPMGTGTSHKDVYLRTSEQIDCD